MGAPEEDKKNKYNNNRILLDKYIKYKTKYHQIAGSITFNTNLVNNKLQELIKLIGKPNLMERDNQGNLKSVTWTNNEDLPFIKLIEPHSYKYHPIPAVVFVLVGRYIFVPDKLIGALKYASETINIEQLFVRKEAQKLFFEKGIKTEALVMGSCASITISAITVKFVEDMVRLYGNSDKNELELMMLFRKEYDDRILNYLCGGNIVPEIEWYNADKYGEKKIFKMDDNNVNKYCLTK